MSTHRASFGQYLTAVSHLTKNPLKPGYIAHLQRVWAEADGYGKKAMVERVNESLREHFGLAEGSKKFAKAMGAEEA